MKGLLPETSVLRLNFEMSRKCRPSDSLTPEIRDLAESIAKRVAWQGSDWPTLARFIRTKCIEACLAETEGNKARAAAVMGVSIKTFRYYLRDGSFGRVIHG